MSFPSVADMFLGRYRLDEVLGQGGFATVFGGYDSAAHRRVALKVLRPRDDGYPAEVVSRFTREVRIVANLRDPHTVTMFDFGTSPDGLLYMVFEHVPGEDLSELITRTGPLPEADAVHVLLQVLSSLREAHRAEMLHRDIKPENIRIYEYGGDPLRVKLLDFGIARPAQSEDSRITRPGELIGTPRYMSPEQLLERDLTPASDLYSLGLVALDLLLGRNAGQGNSWTDQVERLKVGHVFEMPQISSRMQGVVQKMCSRNPEDRFQSTDEVLRALGQPRSSDAISFDEPRTVARPERPEPPEPTDGPTAPLDAVREPETPTPTPWRVPTWVVLALAAAVMAAFVVFLAVALERLTREETAPARVAPRTRDIALIKRAPPTPSARPAAAGGLDSGTADDDASRSAAGQKTSGCGHKPPPKGLSTMQAFDGLSATSWTVYLPRDYDPDVPHAALFLFHDAAQPPELFVRETGFDKLADEHNVVIIAPQDEMIFDGTGLYGRVWESDKSFEQVLPTWQSATEKLCLDTSRVYAVGHAAGGYAAERLACALPLAGLATNAHLKLPSDQTCVPKSPTRHISLLGETDRYCPRNGGVNCASVVKLTWAQKEARWRKINGCGATRSVYLSRAHGTCYTWDCDVDYVTCEHDGGREWPGARPRVWDQLNQRCGGSPPDFPSVETVWNFLSGADPTSDPKP